MFSYNSVEYDSQRVPKYGYAVDWAYVSSENGTATIAHFMMRNPWSPIVWKNGHRLQSHFMSAQWLALDFDDGLLSLDQAKRSFCDMIHIIGTTKSHQKPKDGIVCDRFRVCIKFETTITELRTFRWNMKKAVLKYESDHACVDGARFYYPCVAIVQHSAEGETYEVCNDIDPTFETVDRRYDLSEFRAAGIIPRWLLTRILNPFPQGRKTITCYQVSKDLTKLGFNEQEVLNAILGSPSYKDGVPAKTYKDIIQAVKSGIRSASEEIYTF